MKLKHACSLKEKLRPTWTAYKKQRHYFASKDPSSQSYVFFSSHVWMWELDHKEGWVPKNWCFGSVLLEKTLKSPWIKPDDPKGNQSWIFIGRTETEVEATVFWPPYAKSWLIRKDLDAGKDWGQEEKGTTEDEMVGWHHQLNGHEFEQALGDGEGQGNLACCSPWGCKELEMPERLNNNKSVVWAVVSLTSPTAKSQGSFLAGWPGAS